MSRKDEVDYGRWPYYIIACILAVGLFIINYLYFQDYTSSNSEMISDYSTKDDYMDKSREAAVAGLFYPADVYQLSNLVDGLLKSSSSAKTLQPKIIVVPHAGYMYSAQVAAAAYSRLLPFTNKIHKVIIVGPSHHEYVNGAALSEANSFKTPLGKVSVDTNINNELAAHPDFKFMDKAHAKEHSLEVQIPFLQKTLKKFSIVPIAYGDINPKTLAEALLPYTKRSDVLIVISADLSHYMDYETAQKIDASTAEMVKKKTPLEDHRSCGAIGINAALLLAKEKNYQPRLLDMANSGDVSGDKKRVVGYASWMFEPEETTKEILTPLEQQVKNLNEFKNAFGKTLMEVSHKSLQEAVKTQKKYIPARKDFENVLFNKGASFVTITKNGELRGCIGSLIPHRGIVADVAANTYAAAMEDERFNPIVDAEYGDLEISISLLTDFERISFEDEESLLKQLKPNVDGVVIRDGNRQGLFLPAVWKQLPDKQEFLKNLKLKAGLSPCYWSDKIKAYRFRVVEVKDNED